MADNIRDSRATSGQTKEEKTPSGMGQKTQAGGFSTLSFSPCVSPAAHNTSQLEAPSQSQVPAKDQAQAAASLQTPAATSLQTPPVTSLQTPPVTSLNGQGKSPSTGAILVALGSPTETTEESIADFLREFLSDKRVVDLPSLVWQPILRGPLLRCRPREIKEQYEHIWLPEGSPLRVYTEGQCAALSALLPDVDVRFAYQYGSPNFVDVFTDMAHSCDSISVITTYPQFAPATSGSVADLLACAMERAAAQGLTPHVRASRSWPVLSEYISWHAAAIKEKLELTSIDTLVFSWHGVPDRKAHQGQFYREQCLASSAAIMEELHAQGYEIPYLDTFQSKFGPGKWLEPATIDVMAALPKQGVRKVLVINPGFLADCLETIYEMDVLNAEVFHEAGGESFSRISPPQGNDAARIFAQVYRELNK